MVFTYYTKLFRTGADRRNGILMPLLLSVTETVNVLRLKSLKKKGHRALQSSLDLIKKECVYTSVQVQYTLFFHKNAFTRTQGP